MTVSNANFSLDSDVPTQQGKTVAREISYLAAAAQRDDDPRFGPLFVAGSGSTLWDSNGRSFLDLVCGYSVTNLGHAFAPLMQAAGEQLSTLTHLTGDRHPWKYQLAEQLVGLMPSAEQTRYKVLFNSTGARAIESAWKACTAFRPGKVLAIHPAFHGRSIATSHLSATHRVGPVLEGNSFHVASEGAYPYCDACPLGETFPSCQVRCADTLLDFIQHKHQQISAVFVEPALGARGYVFPPAEFFHRLRDITSRHQILLVADEVQTGLGRCGAMLLSQRQGWTADLIVLGKSLGGGITPISAVIGRAEVLDAIPQRTESETFAATPFACRLGLEMLKLLTSEPWICHGEEMGQVLRTNVQQMIDENQVDAFVGGLGATCVIEFADGDALRVGRERAIGIEQARARRFASLLLDHGVLVHYSGPQQTRVVMLPPLNITPQELSFALERIALAFAGLAAS